MFYLVFKKVFLPSKLLEGRYVNKLVKYQLEMDSMVDSGKKGVIIMGWLG